MKNGPKAHSKNSIALINTLNEQNSLGYYSFPKNTFNNWSIS